MKFKLLRFAFKNLFAVAIIMVMLPALILAQDTVASTVGLKAKPAFFVYGNDTLQFQNARLLKNLGNIPTDLWQIAKSPFQGKNWVVVSAVTGSTLLLVWGDQKMLNCVRKQSDAIHLQPETQYNVFFKVGDTKILKYPKNLNTALYQVGEGGTSMALAAGMWIYGKIAHSKRSIATAYDLAETFVTMGVTTQLLKRISGRESPFMRTVPGGRWRSLPSFSSYQKNTSSYDAFPSGHMATLMATVAVLSCNYPEKKWIKPLGYSVIGLSAWAMMNTEVHWLGDYPLALAIGYLCGRIAAMRHRNQQHKAIAKKVTLEKIYCFLN